MSFLDGCQAQYTASLQFLVLAALWWELTSLTLCGHLIHTASMGGFLAGAFRILVVATQQPTTSWHLFDHLYKNAND